MLAALDQWQHTLKTQICCQKQPLKDTFKDILKNYDFDKVQVKQRVKVVKTQRLASCQERYIK